VLATSGKKDDLEWMLPAIGAAEGVVAGVTTSSDVDASKPHPDLLEVALRDHGLDRGRTAAVGDTVWDVEAASAARLPCVALLTGGIGVGELGGAAAVYEDPASLLDRLGSSPLARIRA